MLSQQLFDVVGRAVADAQPYHLWWESVQGAKFAKISIFGDNNIIMFACIGPNFQIICLI